MKKLLLISYSFPPIQGSESTMAFNSVRCLSKLGWNATVLCAKSTKKDKNKCSMLSEVPKDTSVHRTYYLKNFFIDVLAFDFLKILPDSKIGWLPFAIKKGEDILRKRKIDVIISRSTPVTSHLVALKLKVLTGLPWIACFSDPWTQNPYFFYPLKSIRRFNEYLERKVVFTADKIVFTSKYAKTSFLEKYRTISSDKVIVIPNSYDPSEFLETKKMAPSTKKFTITYTGNFYKTRSPEPLFKALKLLKDGNGIRGKMEVKLIGYIGEFTRLISKYELDEVVSVINTVPRKEVFFHLYNSDVLLLIDAPSREPSVFLPSKLVEYLFTGKPILAITPEGASADVVRETKTGIVVPPDDIKGIKNALRDLYNMYLNSNLKINPDWDEINKYSAERCTELLVKAMREITRK